MVNPSINKQQSTFPSSPATSLPASDSAAKERSDLRRYIRLQLVALGFERPEGEGDERENLLAHSLLANYRQKARLLKDYRCPADAAIEGFLNDLCREQNLTADLRLPGDTFSLNAPRLARELSLPADSDRFENAWLTSYRLRNGVLHNPRSARRTTKGTFHVADIGLPVPADKVAVPFAAFVRLFKAAVTPPADLLTLPFTSARPTPAQLFCSLLLRPLVCPEIPGIRPAQTMEVRFFAPGSLVSNLDFVESIFGNGGDPVLPENDARLDAASWSGHTGCVILAPHLCGTTKSQLGLPKYDDATERQRRDGVCWKSKDEPYNDGQAFKVTCRSVRGFMVTLIADNYYGYCKKEVKTQISFAANVMGHAEEEHAGGAIAFPSYSLGTQYVPRPIELSSRAPQSPAKLAAQFPGILQIHVEGHATDRQFPQLIYIPADATLDVYRGTVSWQGGSIPLLPDQIYISPQGQKFSLDRHPGSGRFRLVTTLAQGTFCHKPCTVSGGGKSEISKSLRDYMIYGPIYVTDFEKDMEQVEAILGRDHSDRWKPDIAKDLYKEKPSRPVLDPGRSLGSVIKLLTPCSDYTKEYNAWLASVPSEILSLVFLIKRLYKPEWGQHWRSHFSVDIVNGEPGHELKVDDRKAGGSYLRVGLLPGGGWRTFKLRQDFHPAAKVQTEDDITASVTVPADRLQHCSSRDLRNVSGSVKILANCEQRLFQRPDDAIHPGLDRQTELDFTDSGNFFSNYEALDRMAVTSLVQRVAEFDLFTLPMQEFLRSAATSDGLIACPAAPRLVAGKPTKNPRYLQVRPDLARPLQQYVADMGTRLERSLPLDAPLVYPVDAVLMGRRLNPPDADAGIRGLAAYNPIHYQELPELFMDVICSLTGKSPSTTGAGSEGALTKGPFNALFTTADLNAALCSFILTGLGGFSTAAGYIGPRVRVDHDISLLVPELWCRLTPQERSPAALIASGCLEKLEDFTHAGQFIPASRLGYRITYTFVRMYFGRIFDSPARVVDEAMLRPETQDMDAYADAILNIAEAQRKVALQYFEDGSIEEACPPLEALLHMMAHGNHEGRTVHDPAVRGLFTREAVLQSDWYRQRLQVAQQRALERYDHCLHYLEKGAAAEEDPAMKEERTRRIALCRRQRQHLSSPSHQQQLQGTIGADPLGSIVSKTAGEEPLRRRGAHATTRTPNRPDSAASGQGKRADTAPGQRAPRAGTKRK